MFVEKERDGKKAASEGGLVVETVKSRSAG